MSLLTKTAIETFKAQIFKLLLSKLSSADLHQRAAAPIFFEKFEEYTEPYVKVLPKAVNFAVTKFAFSMLALGSFFAFFTEALRQWDLQGTFVPTAFFFGYLTVFLISSAVVLAVPAPKVEKKVHLPLPEKIEVPVHPPLAVAPAQPAAAFTNVEQLRRPTTMSATEYLLSELRAERASFLSGRQ